MSKIYLITAIFIGIYGVYFLANKHWFFGIVEIVCSLINALLFISEIKAGGKVIMMNYPKQDFIQILCDDGKLFHAPIGAFKKESR